MKVSPLLYPGLLLYVVSARAQQAPPADTRAFTLTPHYTKGQTLRYDTQSNWTMRFKSDDKTGGSIVLSSVMDLLTRYKVRETKSDGSAVLAVLSDGGKLLDASNTAQKLTVDPENYGRTATLDRQNRLLSLKDPAKTGKGSSLDGLFSQSNLFVPLHLLPLPDKPVKTGDTWAARYPLPNAKPDTNKTPTGKPDDANDMTAIRVTMTLLGTEMLEGQETLKLKQELAFPYELGVDAAGKQTEPGKGTGRILILVTFTQTVNLAPTDGQMLRSQGDIGGWLKFEGSIAKQVPGDTMTITGKIASVRLPEKP